MEFKDNSHNDMHESGAVHKRTNKYGEEEDVLREYVVLDRRTIETNQFADGNIYIYILTFYFNIKYLFIYLFCYRIKCITKK